MKKLSEHKKGQVQAIAPAILSLIFASVVLIFGLVMISETIETDQIAGAGDSMKNHTAYQQGNLTLVGLAAFADFWEIIVLAIVISVVIGLLLVVFGGRTER